VDDEIARLAAAMQTRAPFLSLEMAEDLAELALRPRAASERWVDVREVANLYGVSTKWVYRHATELGVVAMGKGPKPPLRFELGGVAEAIARMRRKPSDPAAERRTSTPRRAPKRGEGMTALGAPLIPYEDLA